MKMNKIIALLLAFGTALAPTMAQITKANPKNPNNTVVKATTNANATQIAALQNADYNVVSEKVILKPESIVKEVIPATFRTVTEQIMVREAHRVGAVMQTVTEQVLVKPASQRIVIEPAVWQTVTKTIVIQEACKGKPQITKTYIQSELVTPAMEHLVEVSAEYRTITRYVVQTPGTGADVPAEYQTVTKTVVYTPDAVREITLRAEFQVFEVKKCK
jgi:hypothetical protein